MQTSTQSIRDTFHALALTCGLTHTGGHGAYSVFTGTREQWRALEQAVVRAADSYHWASVRAVLARIAWTQPTP